VALLREAGLAGDRRAQQGVGVGDLSRAASALRRAVDVPTHDDAARKLRLTYLLNLGDVLQRQGRLDEARAVRVIHQAAERLRQEIRLRS
jgi:hypothetical protein